MLKGSDDLKKTQFSCLYLLHSGKTERVFLNIFSFNEIRLKVCFFKLVFLINVSSAPNALRFLG